MSVSSVDSRLIEKRIFIVTFVFSFVAALFLALQYYLPYYLMDKVGFSYTEYGVFIWLFSVFHYAVTPVLFLAVLYFVCGGRLLERLASTLISLILGCVLGQWFGGLLGIPLFASQITPDWSNALLSTVSQLPYAILGQVLLSFGILAFFDYNKRWNVASFADRSSARRPSGIVILAVLYAIGGLVDACLLPLLFGYSLLSSLFTSSSLLFAGLMAFVVFIGVCQILIAYGLFSGRKWGWIPAFVSSLVSLFSTLTSLLVMAISGVPVLDTFVQLTIYSLFIGLIISLVIMFYLLDFGVRQYFGMVNPHLPSQNP